MKISLLLTGNELMSGDTVDSNSAYIAQSLKDIGVTPYIKKVVGDDLNLLVQSIEELCAVSEVLIINGGLGPTVDDLTALALSKATGSPLRRHPDAMSHLENWASSHDFKLTEPNLKQTDLPETCEVVDNPIGSAVGFHCLYKECLVICTPGVPSEFKKMVEQQVLPLLQSHFDIVVKSKVTRMRLFGMTESGLQDIINKQFPDWPKEIDLGFRVQLPVIEVKLSSYGEENDSLNLRWAEKLRVLLGDFIIGDDNTRLTQALNQTLLLNELVVTTAESCTGGAIAAEITSEAGSSAVFNGGFVVYSNQMKSSILGVSSETLQEHGAVSEQVVLEMAAGAIRLTNADMAMAVSGIAGPTGGAANKPVGTVWMAWGRKNGLKTRKFFLPMSRRAFQKTTTAIAMDLIRRDVLGLDTQVDYFRNA